MVFVHGEEFRLGDSQLFPGHVLAKKEVLVITFNYRLGALGKIFFFKMKRKEKEIDKKENEIKTKLIKLVT